MKAGLRSRGLATGVGLLVALAVCVSAATVARGFAGYLADVAPVTPWGKLAASVVAVLGIGIIALPAGILASAFREQAPRVCPHCGRSFGDEEH